MLYSHFRKQSRGFEFNAVPKIVRSTTMSIDPKKKVCHYLSFLKATLDEMDKYPE
jgi:hypothetical protein